MPTKTELEKKVNQLESTLFEVMEVLSDDDQDSDERIDNALDILEDEDEEDEDKEDD